MISRDSQETEENKMVLGLGILNFPSFNVEKTVEATAYLLQLYGIKQPIKFMRILKLLYLADRKAIEEWERPIIYDKYVSMKHGQVLSNTYDLMKGKIRNETWDKYIKTFIYYWIILKQPIGLRKLSRAEVNLLERIFTEYGKYNEFELAKITHDLPEYVDPGNSSITTPFDKLLKKLGYNGDEVKRIIAELNSEASIDSIFGA